MPTCVCARDGSVTEALAIWLLGVPSSRRIRASATFFLPAKDCSRSRQWKIFWPPLTPWRPTTKSIAALHAILRAHTSRRMWCLGNSWPTWVFDYEQRKTPDCERGRFRSKYRNQQRPHTRSPRRHCNQREPDGSVARGGGGCEVGAS